MKKVILAYSGGLDTSYCAKYLSDDLGYEVIAVSVNTGGFTREEIAEMEEKANELGVSAYHCIQAEQEFYENVVKFLVFGNVLKNNTYPLSVSAERVVQAMEIVKFAKSAGAHAIAHGSTGAGNDQVRFDLIFQLMAPEMDIITPIRDFGLSREDEIAYLKTKGVQKDWKKSKYSINKGLWGTSVGGAETLESRHPLPEEAFPSQVTETSPKTITLEFSAGEVSALNGVKDDAVSIIRQLEEVASAYAIGRDIHVGDTIIGIKGRVGFEAAAPLILIKAHHLLEKHTLSKWQLFQKEQLSNFYGMLLHEGQYLDPVMRDLEAFLLSSQSRVNGTVYIRLHPYRFELQGIESPNDLMENSFGNYGETNKAWTAEDAKGFINILSNAGKIYEHVNQEK